MIFLSARPIKPNIGTLLVSLDSGLIQVWSHHAGGGFLQAFSVIHAVGDCALSLTTDPENNFLVTGKRKDNFLFTMKFINYKVTKITYI